MKTTICNLAVWKASFFAGDKKGVISTTSINGKKKERKKKEERMTV